YERGTTPLDVAASIGKRLAKDALAAKVDGEWVDLSQPLDHAAKVELITPASDDGREVLRHSTAHVMAQAVTELFPGTKYAIGPPIEDGFYYDFECPHVVVPEDLKKIEDRMRDIVKDNLAFVMSTHSSVEARQFWGARGVQ